MTSLHGGLASASAVIAPEGSVVNALPPAAMAAGNVETSQRITDALLGRAGAGRAGAHPGGFFGHHEQPHVGGFDTARAEFCLLRNHAGGMGASRWGGQERRPHPHDE